MPKNIPDTAQAVARLVDGVLVGDGTAAITGVASVEEARPGDLVFAESARYLELALRSRATAILAPLEAGQLGLAAKPLILVAAPRLAFVKTLEAFAPPLEITPGIDPTAQIGQNADFGPDVHLGAHVSVGANVTLGRGVILLPGARVGDDCAIGDDTILHPNVVLYPRVRIGRRCLLHAGCVLGADGFGYVPVGTALRKVPQLGVVEVGDDVEIGANTCIDRAKTGATVIGSGTKIDNLVHVGHNVTIGFSTIIIAQTGIAGSVTIGNGVILAGQAGVKDHVTIGDGARVGAQGGVISDVPAGVTVSGYPARPHRDKMREHAATAALPEYLKRIRDLERRLADLEAKSGQ